MPGVSEYMSYEAARQLPSAFWERQMTYVSVTSASKAAVSQQQQDHRQRLEQREAEHLSRLEAEMEQAEMDSSEMHYLV